MYKLVPNDDGSVDVVPLRGLQQCLSEKSKKSPYIDRDINSGMMILHVNTHLESELVDLLRYDKRDSRPAREKYYQTR